MRRKRLSGLSFLVMVILSLALPTSTADCDLEFRIPEQVYIRLSRETVDLGAPMGKEPFYYEKVAAVRVDYRCNIPTNWEVRIYAEDFRDGNKTIPISRLQWRPEEGNSSYQPMPTPGSYAVLARRRDHLPWAGVQHSKRISYRLELRGDELEGTYTAPITYSLFVP
ncbi:MAG: hypothetical protein GX050_06995 [Firmicutes bacterium]|nr:hypothetical protein [Bacillota bacterium]